MAQAPITSKCCKHCGADVAIEQEPGGDLSYVCQNAACRWACSIHCPEALNCKTVEPLAIEPIAPAVERARNKAAYNLGLGLRIVEHNGAYLVPSGTRSSMVHRVSAGNCSCEARGYCWHLAAVELVEAVELVAA